VCPLCGAWAQRAVIFRERDHDVVGCDRCDLYFIRPYPADSSNVHEIVSEFQYQDLEILDAERQYRGEVELFERAYPALREACRGASSVLDVGCGTGRLLELLGEHPGRYRAGIELNKERAQFARANAACDIHQVPVEQFVSDRTFDVIILYNVLSHLPSFDRLFAALRRLLADDGRLILKVGEMERGFDHRAIFDWGIPDHLHFLGMRTIDFIAARFGFEISLHQRAAYSAELFRRERWKAPGRSRGRNLAKRIVAATPGALTLLAAAYDRRYGRRIFSSFIVLARRTSHRAL
jgi:SAM-dependent methyltransferase